MFAGRRIVVRSGRYIKVGRTILIGDDVVLDALSSEGITLGDNVSIGRGATLMCCGVLARPGVGIRIGDRTGVSEYCQGVRAVSTSGAMCCSGRAFGSSPRITSSRTPID